MKNGLDKKDIYVKRPDSSNSQSKKEKQTKNVFVEKPKHSKSEEKEKNIKVPDEDGRGKTKDLIAWIAFGIFAFWTFCLLAGGNPVSAIITAALAFFISPLRKKIFERWGIKLAGKKLAFIGAFLFLSSCGTFIGLTDTEEASDTGQQLAVVESMEESSYEELLVTESKEESLEEVAETLTELSTIEIPESSTYIETQTLESESEFVQEEVTAPEISPMQVHFIDVGQGDATLITCGGESMLIDAGDNSKGTTVQLYLKKQGVEELKYLILTHPDADHIGGADVIVTKLDIENVFMSDFTKDNKTYNELIGALDSKSLKWTTPNVGNTYSLGSAEFTIIAPNTSYDDPNDASIGLVLKNGENAFLFTGDAEEEAEYDILSNGLDIDCDVYKAGHHGSKTSNSEALLEEITPEYVVVSCEEGNSYGHPHAGPMNRFRSMGMKLFRTDEQGSVIATSDGAEITWNCAPSDSWQAGESTQSSSATVNSSKEKTQAQNSSNVQVEQQAAPEPEAKPEPEPEPQVQPEPQPQTDPNAGILVWKSATGKKYHSINDCGNMNPNKATQMTKAEAEALGLGQCSKCW